ncbi:MAG: endonuclease/exonuclease/phosphatase family protein [Actinomycetota bacterium]
MHRSHRFYRFKIFLASLIAFVAVGLPTTAHAKAAPELTFMTRNLYLGADIVPLASATDVPSLIAAVDAAWANVQATNFGVRANAIASEIAAAEPDFVGLQEAVTWRIGATLFPPPSTVVYDFVTLLLDALSAQGQHYHVVISKEGVDASAPSDFGVLRITDHDVLIARDDIGSRGITVANLQSSTYATNFVVDNPLVGSLVFKRQWVSADVTVGKKTVRVISTHLEVEDFAPVQIAQVQELLAGPAKTNLPIVLVCDCNSAADGSNTATYSMLLAAGFVDTWTEANGIDPGYSCCQAADLANTTSHLHERIDLVLHKRSVQGESATLVGEQTSDMISGLWPSDHAGVVGKLQILGA